MLPASGLFAEVVCPFRRRAVCERPHCLYKHEEEVHVMFAASLKSTIGLLDFPGIPNHHSTESSESLQELARLNREIEDVKTEVEQEQRRLSLYQTQQGHRGTPAPAAPQRAHQDGDSHTPPLQRRASKPSPHARKYVVDHTKPRTDLEYDPLSNFSADLRSYSPSCRDPKDKAGVKRAGDVSRTDRQKLQPAINTCPVLEDDLPQEGDLVIDIPSSPELKRFRAHDVIENRFGAAELRQSSLHVEADCRTAGYESSTVESSSDLPIQSDESVDGSARQPVDIFDGLSKCLEDLRSESVEERRKESAGDAEVKGRPETRRPSKDHRSNVHFNGVSAVPAPPQTNASAGGVAPAPQHYWTPAISAPTVLPWGRAPALPGGGSGTLGPLYSPSGSSVQLHEASPQTPPPPPPPRHEEQPMGVTGEWKTILIESSSEGEGEGEGEVEVKALLTYSDVDLSDSDPMEECYRIFMEANEAEGGAWPAGPPDPPALNGAELVESAVAAAALVEEKQQRRVAHVPRRGEPVVMVRPQPQILVPLRAGPSGPQLPHPARVLPVQQRAPPPTVSVKPGQTFPSSAPQRRPDTGSLVPQNHVQNHVQHPVSLQSAYMSCIPMGNAVIQVGNNLHFILPEGSYPLPLPSMAGAVSPVLTPISSLNPTGTTTSTTMASFQLSTVTPVHRYRPDPLAPPVHTLGNGPLLASASASGPQGALHVAPKPLTKRKVKQRAERVKDKVPHDVRQRYVNMFTEEFLKTSPSVKDSFEKALAEERAVYNRSINKLKYLSVAVNALKRLKNQTAVSSKDENKTHGKRAKGNIPFNVSQLACSGDAALYESLKEYVMDEEMLIEQNYPLQNPERPGHAVLFSDARKGVNDPLKRICCRCGATYSVSKAGKHTRKEECTYHYGKGVERKVPGGVETRYSCCEGVMGAPGCQVFRLHVHDAVNMDGFVSSQPRRDLVGGCPGVFSLDCEMCYTTHGLELARVTVVNAALQVVYDTFVRPDNDVVDFNTRFSGISETDLKEDCPSIGEVQQTLLRFVFDDTILVGHGLDTSLCALKVLHGTVVDTSVVFPHRLGHPHKMTLNNLTADYLRRIIQDSVCGHDTADDAAACMELLLWKVKEDGKGRKW